jgi:hypothetical protein
VQHLLSIHEEPSGQFTAQAVGIPEARATAATREVAIQHVTAILNQMQARGLLVSVPLQQPPVLPRKPRTPEEETEEQLYLEELARHRRAQHERDRAVWDNEDNAEGRPDPSTTPP